MYPIFGLAIIAIAMQIAAFYVKNGFDWVWFICLEVPLYSFCIWAFVKAWKMYKSTLKKIEENEKIKQEKLEKENEK